MCNHWTSSSTPIKSWYMNHRAKPGQAYIPTNVEHIANVVTHALLIPPSLVGLMYMLHLASSPTEHTISWVYGLALFTLFTVSTIFHTICYSNKFMFLKEFFHIGDRAVIYIFIAASYTPWLSLKDFGGYGVFTLYVVWVCAILGIIYQYTFHEQYKWLETLLYVVLGVCPSGVVMLMDLFRDVPELMKDDAGMTEMIMGGIVYILGLVFFKSDGVIPFAHAIWHCFVFVGAILHYSAVCKYLLGAPHGIIGAVPFHEHLHNMPIHS